MRGGTIEVSFFILLFLFQLNLGLNVSKNQQQTNLVGALSNGEKRQAWQQQMLGDPTTGKIPSNYSKLESEFLADFQTSSRSGNLDNLTWDWTGPINYGGRTRALQFDITDTNNLLAGSASGGIFKSTNGGKSWTKVSKKDHNLAITSIAQNKNSGKENIWYACTGELRGGNQISGNSVYSGNGILKSEDSGNTWDLLTGITNPSPQSLDSTDRGWRIIVSNQNSDVYFASSSGIHKSIDGGNSWSLVLGRIAAASGYTDVIQTKNGILYASLNNGGLGTPGVYRSVDGDTWNLISSGTISANMGRGVLAVDQQFNGERIYVLAQTPNQGKAGYDFQGSAEYHSLYKYTYNSSGGTWENLSQNLPGGPFLFDDYVSQGAYCMDIAVSPHDSNIISIGGTNLYISHDAFKSDTNTSFAGGYGEKTELPDFQVYPNHHPDLQTIVFHPSNANVLLTGSDGGLHRTENLYDKNVVWVSLNRTYSSTQFYTLAIDDHVISDRIMGGLQDNGTFLSVSGDGSKDWTMPMSYDGGYCAFSDKEPYIYASKQLAGIAKIEIDSKGERVNWKRIDPVTNSNYMFINPYTLDPEDNNVMYLPILNELWVNDNLSAFIPDSTFDRQTLNWNVTSLPNGFQPSAIEVSHGKENRVILGSSSGEIIIVKDPITNPQITNINNGIPGRGYINSISVNPKNEDNILVVFSNYNTYSVFITYNSGNTWDNISGNLEGTPIPGLPPGLERINNGPSCRVGKIINLADTTLYLVGTSVGLFQTVTLDSMNTQWEPMAEESIQNNVVSRIVYRSEDGFLGVSTFGAGVFNTYVKSYDQLTSIENSDEQTKATIYPNPTSDYFSISGISNNEVSTVIIVDLNGRTVYSGGHKNQELININQLSPGSYVVSIELANGYTESKRIIKQ
ncbi:MAG: T9SS type A sorting domain-containing protein [Salibacteraceae bacterium]